MAQNRPIFIQKFFFYKMTLHNLNYEKSGGKNLKMFQNITKNCWSVHTKVFRYLRVWISTLSLATSSFYLLALNRIIIFALLRPYSAVIQGYGDKTMKWIVISLIYITNHLAFFLISRNYSPCGAWALFLRSAIIPVWLF